MTLNHIGTIFLEPGTFTADVFIGIGFFTLVTMCYCLVEGYRYTRDRKKYGIRLLMFGLISQIPYNLAFTREGVMTWCDLNVLFTLFICYLMIIGIFKVKSDLMRLLVVGAAMGVSALCDGAFIAPLFTLIFLWSYGDRRKVRLGYLIPIGIMLVYYLLEPSLLYHEHVTVSGIFCSVIGVALSALCIGWLYNGRRSTKFAGLNKWFFYIYYPLHLLVLGLLRIYM